MEMTITASGEAGGFAAVFAPTAGDVHIATLGDEEGNRYRTAGIGYHSLKSAVVVEFDIKSEDALWYEEACACVRLEFFVRFCGDGCVTSPLHFGKNA